MMLNTAFAIIAAVAGQARAKPPRAWRLAQWRVPSYRMWKSWPMSPKSVAMQLIATILKHRKLVKTPSFAQMKQPLVAGKKW